MGFDIENGVLKLYEAEYGVTDVVIPDGVKRIDSDAFFYANNEIESLTIPDSMEIIEPMAFQDFVKLREIVIPESVTSLGKGAFNNCSNLTRAVIKGKIRSIENFMFAGCRKLVDIELPDTIETIDENAFLDCTALSSIIIPESVTSILGGAFNGCTALSDITLPEGLCNIGRAAFANCPALTAVTIPESAAQLGEYAFYNCDKVITNLSLNRWQEDYGFPKWDYAMHYMRAFESGNPFFETVKAENNECITELLGRITEELDINGDDVIVRYLPENIDLNLYQVDDLIFRMSGNADCAARLLEYKNSHFPKDILEEYERGKIAKERGEKERTLEDWERIFTFEDDGSGGYKITGYIGKSKDVAVPEAIAGKPVTAIASYAFSPLTSRWHNYDFKISKTILQRRAEIERIVLPNSIVDIEEHAFAECAALKEVILPQGLKTIRHSVFYECESLTDIVIPPSVELIDGTAFLACTSLKEIKIPKSVTKIEGSAFAFCTSLTRIEIPAEVKRIYPNVFNGSSDSLVIATPSGSYALNFAKVHNIGFEEVQEDLWDS